MKALTYGPLNKSLHTQQYELLVKCIINNPESIHYDIHRDTNGKDALFAQIGQTQLNISSLVQKVNFNHLSFSERDSHIYQSKMLDSFYQPNFEDRLGKYSDLSYAEKFAILQYSGNAYYGINSFLHGKVDSLESSWEFLYEKNLDPIANKLVMSIGLLASGLNKIMPDIDFTEPTFRGEHGADFEEICYRIQLIDNNDGLDKSPAFMSTSADSDISRLFSTGSHITFENAYGKDISGLSMFTGEAEYLLNPNQIIWEDYSYHDGTFHFKARVVAPLIEGQDAVTQEDIANFNEILNFSKEANIDIDFITDFNKANYVIPENNNAIPLHEIIDCPSGITDFFPEVDTSLLTMIFSHNPLESLQPLIDFVC